MNPWRRICVLGLRVLLVVSIVWGAVPWYPAAAAPGSAPAAAPLGTDPGAALPRGVAETAAPAHLHSGYQVVKTFTRNGNRCNLLRVPVQAGVLDPSGPLGTLADFNNYIMWSNYQWMAADGATTKIFRVVGTNLYIQSVAGSTVSLLGSEDLESLPENLFSESGRGNPLAGALGTDPMGYINEMNRNGRLGSDYLEFTSQALQDAAGNLIPPGSQLAFAGHSQGGNTTQLLYLAAQSSQPTGTGLGVPRNDIGDALGVQGIDVVGGTSAGSRPHQTVDRMNNQQQATTGQRAWVHQNEVHDPVGQMYSPATAGNNLNPVDTLLSSAGALVNTVAGHLGALPPAANNTANMANTAGRSAVLFDDPGRYGATSDQSAHGEAYIDPHTQGATGNMNVDLPGDANDVNRPLTESPAEYTGDNPNAPDWLQLALTNGIEYVGGYAYDCYSAVTITADEYRQLQQECGNPADPYGVGPKPISELIEERRNQPDGIPDKMWVQITEDGAGQGRQLPPASLLRQTRNEIEAWRQGGQVGPNPSQAYFSNNNLTFNRDYLFVEDQGTLNPHDPCKEPPRPPDDGGENGGGGRRRANGGPDDYEAPWRYQDPTQVSATWLNDLVGDTDLEPWSPAWNMRLQSALQQRMGLAEQIGQPEAARFYRSLAAASNLVTRVAGYAADPEYGYLLAAQATASDISDQRELELALGLHNGAPITDTAPVYDYWAAQLEAAPDWQAFEATALGQRVEADGLEWTTLLSQTTALVETYGAEGYATRVQRAVNIVERAASAAGVGVLKAGLENWTQGALGYAGVAAQIIDPLTTAPLDVPLVLIVPSGALEEYEAWPYLRLWLEEYVGSGGTLLVQAQAFGRHWELLPGGEVQGLGFEEDILCKEESVEVVGDSPYLAGFHTETPNVQVDGSFTAYPAGARVLLQRRTGNLMPAMIEYPYGAGTVLATSLYPDFAAINGIQARDDLPFMRTFFLQAWAEATGEFPETEVPPSSIYTFTVTVQNLQATPWTAVRVDSEYSRDAPEVWRYRAHYDSWKEYGHQLAAVVIPLTPPLAPGETRAVQVAFKTPVSSGLHRLAFVGNPPSSSSGWQYTLNTLPGPLYLVESPFYVDSSANMRAQADRARYWADETVVATVVLSPTADLSETQVVTLTAQPAVFPPQPVTLTPGGGHDGHSERAGGGRLAPHFRAPARLRAGWAGGGRYQPAAGDCPHPTHAPGTERAAHGRRGGDLSLHADQRRHRRYGLHRDGDVI